MSNARLAQLLEQAELTGLTSDTLERFDCYLDLLLKWNSRLNLTAIRDSGTVLRRHFVECIQCAQALPKIESSTLLDFGSGAGLPGIPIAICRPEIRVTLAESQRKKAAFLREVVRTLALSAEIFDGRVENMPEDRRFDVVTLRAVDRMQEACETAFSRLKPGGRIVVFSTAEAKLELQQALPSIPWLHEIRSVGLDQGLLLFGQRLSSAN